MDANHRVTVVLILAHGTKLRVNLQVKFSKYLQLPAWIKESYHPPAQIPAVIQDNPISNSSVCRRGNAKRLPVRIPHPLPYMMNIYHVSLQKVFACRGCIRLVPRRSLILPSRRDFAHAETRLVSLTSSGAVGKLQPVIHSKERRRAFYVQIKIGHCLQ